MWTSSDVNGGSWGDIIPPNNNNQDSKNWTTAGQAIYKGQVFVASTGLPACRGMTLKAYVDALRDANVSDADIVADLNEADADEDKAILSKAGQSTFTTSNLTTVANASQSISATTSAATSISTSGATLNGSFKTDATSVSWYFEYNQGDSTFADAPSETTCTSLGATNTTLSRSASISSLTSNRKYFFRAVIVDSCGASPSILLYGEVYSFTTSSTVYRVTYNENGGTGAVPTDPNVYIANEKAYVYGNTGGLTKSGAVFKHWATSPSGSALRAGTPPSLTLKSSPDIKVLGGSSSNWAFLKVRPRVTEFYTYGSGSELTVTSDTTLYAIYETAYTVTYNGNTNSGGSAPTDSNSYANGATVTVLGNTGTLTKDGYTFANWCTTQPAAGSTCTGTTQAASSTFTMGTSNVNLYAIWTANTLTVTYNSQGGSAISSGSTTTGGSIASSPGSPTRSGYTFNGWFAASSGGSAISFPYTHGQTANFTLFAQWSGNKYVYDGNTSDGGSTPAEQVYSGSTITARANTFTKSGGYSFYGWCLTITALNGTCSGTKYSAGNSLPTPDASTVTLYAVWSSATLYSITYESQGGTSVSPTSFASGDTVSLPSAPTRTGYTFNGWYDASSGGTKVGDAGASYGPLAGANITRYAQWTINQYTITYNGNGNSAGSAPSPVSVNYNDSHTVLSQLTLVRDGYTFGNWNTNSDGTSGSGYLVSDTFTVTTNVTLYAVWVADAYVIQYNGNGNTDGSAPIDQEKNMMSL